MSGNEPFYVVCHNGVFILPERIFRALSTFVSNGCVYLRQDVDTLTISATRLTDGHRRQLSARFRAPMFRNARKLAIVDLNDSVQVMAVSSAAK
ncbi:MAG TPA: hypothetical protein VGF48_10855 [Thermoanaerobaculia bacterium]|jgi:hypothetical protein